MPQHQPGSLEEAGLRQARRRDPRPWESDEGLWENSIDGWDMIGENIRRPQLLSSIFSGFLWDRSSRRGRRRWEDAAQTLSAKRLEENIVLGDGNVD